jgi:hypothetical protein
MLQSLLPFAACIPALIILAAVFFERGQRKRRGERPPLSEKLLRPAGYSLQRKLEDLNDSFMAWFMGTFLFSMGAIGTFTAIPTDIIGRYMVFILCVLGAAGAAIMAWRKAHQIRAHRCGLLGEQAMAEQLQPLWADGYRLFHDLPCEKGHRKWNIDHVVVGPAGVFAIETKYKTKRPGKAGGPAHEATFDGAKIRFPSGGYDAKAVPQARGNAQWLATELSKATGDRVLVHPIVALPGWMVQLKVDVDIKVLSGKYVSKYIASEPVQLSDKAIRQISYQLDQRCRDVEY